MTGLDPEVDRILEAGVIITDKYLEPVFEWETAVYQSPEVLESMNDWCKFHHYESGLLERVPEGMSEEDLDRTLSEIAIQHFKKKNPVVICGNSIAQDRKFIDKYLPKLAERLHYRMLDVSSFKIVFREMLGREFKKAKSHRALDDIRESIAEMKYYMGAIDPSDLSLIDNSHSPPASSETKRERDSETQTQ